jgi:hypothetical protein
MRRLSFRRRFGAVLIAIALVPFGATAASAKMPYVSVEITPPNPGPDEPSTIVARTWSDPDHMVAVDWGVEDLLDGLFVIRPAGMPGPDLAVDMTQTADARFEATLSLPAGDWELVAFPDRSGWGESAVPDGYPDRVVFSVRSPVPDLSGVLGGIGVAVRALFATIASLATGFAMRP